MFKNVDKNMLKSAVIMSLLFTVLICIAVYEIASEPYLIYDLGKVLKGGSLSPIKLTLGLALPTLFLTLIVTLFSIAYYRVSCDTENEENVVKKKGKGRRK